MHVWCAGVPCEGDGINQRCRVHRGFEQRVPADVRRVTRRHLLGADGGRALRHAGGRQEHTAVSCHVGLPPSITLAAEVTVRTYAQGRVRVRAEGGGGNPIHAAVGAPGCAQDVLGAAGRAERVGRAPPRMRAARRASPDAGAAAAAPGARRRASTAGTLCA